MESNKQLSPQNNLDPYRLGLHAFLQHSNEELLTKAPLRLLPLPSSKSRESAIYPLLSHITSLLITNAHMARTLLYIFAPLGKRHSTYRILSKLILNVIICITFTVFQGCTQATSLPNPQQAQDKRDKPALHNRNLNVEPPPSVLEGKCAKAKSLPTAKIATIYKRNSTHIQSTEKLSDAIELWNISSSPSLSYILTVGRDGKVILWKVRKGTSDGVLLAQLPPSSTAKSAFSHHSHLLAYSVGENLYILSIASPALEQQTVSLSTRIQSLAFTPSGKSLIVGGSDGNIYEIPNVKEWNPNSPTNRYLGSSSPISAIVSGFKGKVFFSGNFKGDLIAWVRYSFEKHGGFYDKNLGTKKYVEYKSVKEVGRKGNGVGIDHIAINCNGTILYAALQDGTVEAWKIKGFKLLASKKIHSTRIKGLYANGISRFLTIWSDKRIILTELTSTEFKSTVIVPVRRGEGPPNQIEKIREEYELANILSVKKPKILGAVFSGGNSIITLEADKGFLINSLKLPVQQNKNQKGSL
ncbi:MAG: hypothetical protein D6808_01565 [Candidatus Dadabacteria bacterium]|nr:MAG: hypothetical protein D6808_01565 [Candidatus Dadabacteria bacterium]